MRKADRSNLWIALVVATAVTVVLAAVAAQEYGFVFFRHNARALNLFPVWTVEKESGRRPFAVREGIKVTILPCAAHFDVPENWARHFDEHRDNFHLSLLEIDAVANGDGGLLDSAAASVCNAIFPIDRCAFHGGDSGKYTGHGAIQLRVYHLLESCEAIEQRIDAYAADSRRPYDPRSVSLDCARQQPWRMSRITFSPDEVRWSFDIIRHCDVEIRLRTFGEQTIAMVFMYDRRERDPPNPSIEPILASFVWPDKQNQGSLSR